MNTKLIQKNNISFTVSLKSQGNFWENTESKDWDELPLKLLDRFIEKDKIFIDIGAWIGATTLYCASRSCQVFSFEPDPVAFSAFSENISLNKDLSKRIKIYNKAITSTGGKIRLHIRHSPGDAGSSILPAINSSGDFVEVDSIKFNVLLIENKITEIGLVKVDIEAGEFYILPSIIADLKKLENMPHLCIEFHYSKLLEFCYNEIKSNIKPALLGRGLSFLDRKLTTNFMSKSAEKKAKEVSRKIIDLLKNEYSYVYNQQGRSILWEDLMGYLGNVAFSNDKW